MVSFKTILVLLRDVHLMTSHKYSGSIYSRVSLFAGIFLAFFAVTVLFGWFSGIEILKCAFLAGISVKTNTAIGFLLSGICIVMLSKKERRPSEQFLLKSLSIAVAFLGFATLSEHVFNINLGIDQLFFSEPIGLPATSSPNRMGPPASFNFLLAGTAFILTTSSKIQKKDLAAKLAIIIGIVGLLSTLGYLFGATALYGIASFTGIAFSTSIAFLILSLGIVLCDDDSSLINLLRSQDAGGVLIRRLMPPAIILPPLLGYIRTQGEKFGLFEAAFGRSILITAFILIFARLVWTSARIVQEMDQQRQGLIDRERSARNLAEKANRFKDDFLATLSHELRSPLNAILGWSQLLKKKGASSPEVSTGLEIIERNARIQARLIDDLLDMSRIISGKISLQIKEVDLRSILIAAIQMIGPEAESKKIQLTNEIPDGVFNVKGDAARLQQVFWNILSNAVKFTPQNGNVLIELKAKHESVEVLFTDSGQGIEAEFIDRIFDRFSQADSSITRKFGGLGIGLSVVKELVLLHCGTASVTSKGKGLGATFKITLPLSTTSENVAMVHSLLDNQVHADGYVNLKGIQILVVDDDSDSRDVVGRILEQTEADVIFASSAAEALEKVKGFRPNILVSDIGMPGQDGYQLIREIRKIPGAYAKQLPAIALTAFVREEEANKAIESGYQAHLGKPVNAIALINLIDKLKPKA